MSILLIFLLNVGAEVKAIDEPQLHVELPLQLLPFHTLIDRIHDLSAYAFADEEFVAGIRVNTVGKEDVDESVLRVGPHLGAGKTAVAEGEA